MTLLTGIGAVASSGLYDVEESLDAVGIIEHWGYPAETHTAETEDGWLLDIHRIPHGKVDDGKTNKPVVILHHGVECASDNFVLNLPNQSAGFVFADAGFDVWMPNSRGNTYTNHVKYNRLQPDFWKFTADDMQKYDLPAVFDLIENVTGQSSVYYVGHSQGTVIMFAKLSDDPSFNRRLKKFFALGPGVQFTGVQGPFRLICQTDSLILGDVIWDLLPWTEFALGLLDQKTVDVLAALTCTLDIQREYCANVFYWIGGKSIQTNVTRMNVFLTHIPAGTSTANIQRYCQSLNNGGFNWYKFPTEAENIAHYGSATPPSYDLSNVNVPIYLYTTPLDYFTTQQDLDGFLIPHLNDSLIVEYNRYPNYSHMDLIWGLNATADIFSKIVNTINEDLAGN
ncbi:unnamed protein product [Bursaphelenchus xylophilus]|uniref:Lipase n=1 Tax=Bursaphelenchus xylophilus TaxID=6326 RepID=A0A1I7SL28_BURXY|nr:unnamed protein product [Bursaphelenchus xylophilus]CAG9129346.1 unnamed protein product [Bursaphelenchus xylophilus]